jgi:3'-phosphoadenosine 5'-phosphosulfate sulfotransferase (PAPS reductase)/FAD synthetase
MTAAKNAAENDLRDFDWVVVSSSAGKDSQAMLDLIVEKARQADVLDRVVVVHADLGRVEWQATSQPMPEGVAEISVPDLAAEHAKAYGLRFEIVTRPQGDLLEQIEERGMFPGMGMTQYCTSDHKTAQIKKLFTRLVRETNEADPSTKSRRVRILDCVGLRAKESDKRSDHLLGGHWKADEWIVKGEALPIDANGFAFELNKRASNPTKREVISCYPIADWSEAEVWARIDQAVTRSHWAYQAGMPRLSCCFCIYASKHALMIAGRHNPDLLVEYVRVEKAIGHNFHGEPGKSGSFSIASIAEALETGTEIEDEGWGNS